MNILCFASAAAMLEKVSKSVIHLNTPGISIELYKSFPVMYQRLCLPVEHRRILILCPKNKKEINELISIYEVLSGAKIILVLPKRDQNSIKTAYRIFPRFLAFADEDFTPITRIVEKMISCAAAQTGQL